MTEERGELSAAYNKQRHDQLVDSIGNLQVALLIFCKLVGVDHQAAPNEAYSEIKNRCGKTTESGAFIKESDLNKRN